MAASCNGGDLSLAVADGLTLCFVVVRYQPAETRKKGSTPLLCKSLWTRSLT